LEFVWDVANWDLELLHSMKSILPKNKVERLLGLARRARKLAIGSTEVEQQLKKQRVKLLVFAEDASANSRRKVLELARGCPVVTYGTVAELGALLGREKVAVLGVLDVHFAKGILEEMRKGEV